MQTGGSFDINYDVVGPNGKTIMGNQIERQVDSVFTAKEIGEYRFCLDNEMSTFAEKMVDFEIAVGTLNPTANNHYCNYFTCSVEVLLKESIHRLSRSTH